TEAASSPRHARYQRMSAFVEESCASSGSASASSSAERRSVHHARTRTRIPRQDTARYEGRTRRVENLRARLGALGSLVRWDPQSALSPDGRGVADAA